MLKKLKETFRHLLTTEREFCPKLVIDNSHSCNLELRDRLAVIFPVIEQVVGSEYFTELADQYQQQHPGSEQDRLYGDYFPHFLLMLSSSRMELDKLLFLPEMARLEWALYSAENAQQDPDFSFNLIEQVPDAKQPLISFTASHSLNIIYTEWPVYDMWQRFQLKQQIPENLKELEGGWLCVYRSGESAVVEKISADLALLLSGILQRQELHELASKHPDCLDWLRELCARGWLTGVRVPG